MFGEKLVKRVPIVNIIYTTLKQITDTFTNKKADAFDGVVYIQYPREGIWTMAFISGSSKDGNEIPYYHIFVPTTPNPTSGFLLMFPEDEVLFLDMTFEEASNFIVSAGTSNPTN